MTGFRTLVLPDHQYGEAIGILAREGIHALGTADSTHNAYANSEGEGYRAACHDCAWRGETLHPPTAEGKQLARDDAAKHDLPYSSLGSELFTQFDAIPLGEALREMTFTGDGHGCYSNFDLREDGRVFEHMERIKFWMEVAIAEQDNPHFSAENMEEFDERAQMGRGIVYQIDGYQIEMVYFWDGDGYLAFRVKDDAENVVAFIRNTDCKGNEWESLL